MSVIFTLYKNINKNWHNKTYLVLCEGKDILVIRILLGVVVLVIHV